MKRMNKAHQKKWIFGIVIIIVAIFIIFFNATQKNKTLAKVTENYQLSDTYMQESLLDISLQERWSARLIRKEELLFHRI